MGAASDIRDVIVVGAGPIGIATGIEVTKQGFTSLLIEKGCLTNSIFHFPTHMTFFSTPELLELGDVPFIVSGQKPTRREALEYYKRVAQSYRLDIHAYESVTAIYRENGFFTVHSNREQVYSSRTVVLAIGFYDYPNLLHIPGENLSKVSHYYTEPHPYYKQKVAIIGGQNSAVEAALELYRAGAEVTLIHRDETLGSGIKYWVRPDIDNRIKEGSIRAIFNAVVERIDAKTIRLRHHGETETLENDFVLALTGYHVDFAFLEQVGVELEGAGKKPVHNPETMETNLERVYLAGVATGGMDSNKIFIENGRVHAKMIARDIAQKLGRKS